MTKVVKRRGKEEPFDEKKFYDSVFSACKECDLGDDDARKISDKVTADINKFVGSRDEINTTEIFAYALQLLAQHHEAVAFMYQTHRDLSSKV
ncbi:hypothetical protein JXA56_01285 [Candidatus Micrarchaeota archaeon]|nr:hypothetical protein [Candidatus Micrarchaeota archaeon]